MIFARVYGIAGFPLTRQHGVTTPIDDAADSAAPFLIQPHCQLFDHEQVNEHSGVGLLSDLCTANNMRLFG